MDALGLSVPARISVRELVEFAWRGGDLQSGAHFRSAHRARQGSDGHRLVQQSRPEGYQAEVAVNDQLVHEAGVVLQIDGRVDGVLAPPHRSEPLVEEIKTVQEDWDGSPRELHWAQARIYAAILSRRHQWELAEVQLTYLMLETGDLSVFRKTWTRDELDAFYQETSNIYLDQLADQALHIRRRNAALADLRFPFPTYRRGQEALTRSVYTSCCDRTNTLLEAPTGSGKTISTLYPALRSLAVTNRKRLVYLCARTSGRSAAELAAGLIRETDVPLRSLSLAARDQVCFVPPGEPRCDPLTCPYALGYFDRRREAIKAALEKETLTPEELRDTARQHQVCPFALGLDLTPWVDLVIGDYNYVFDPRIKLATLTEPGDDIEPLFLVDEAHQLVDRCRDMFSATLDSATYTALGRQLAKPLPNCKEAVEQINAAFGKLAAIAEDNRVSGPGGELLRGVRMFNREAEARLAKPFDTPCREALLEAYFQGLTFLKINEMMSDGGYECMIEPLRGNRGVRCKLLCADPSVPLRRHWDASTNILLSATLRPFNISKRLLGVTNAIELTAPPAFHPDQLGVFVRADLDTTYHQRQFTAPKVGRAIADFLKAHNGRYLVFFPSYQYLEQVLPHVKLPSGWHQQVQEREMDPDDRAEFLRAFSDQTALAAFAVLGGVFAEGIDLPGELLDGAVVVGVGMPQINRERDIIRSFYDAAFDGDPEGFTAAYLMPGMVRVLQAAGRVIRGENDRGTLLLIDRRYRNPAYRNLLPRWWNPVNCTERNQTQAVKRFW